MAIGRVWLAGQGCKQEDDYHIQKQHLKVNEKFDGGQIQPLKAVWWLGYMREREMESEEEIDWEEMRK